MIFICTATYFEAEPFIKEFQLKKDVKEPKFKIFYNKNIKLLITGVGKIKCAIALTYLFSKNRPLSSDLFVNIGLCGSANINYTIGQTFLCNKIIDNDTKKTYYTDILFKHPFKETSIETFSVITHSHYYINGELVDMESSALFESALTFMQSHQIFFIKIISDHLSSEKVNLKLIKDYIYEECRNIVSWLNHISSEFKYNTDILSPKYMEIIDKISDNLKLSCTLKNELKQILKYYKLANGDFSKIITDYMTIDCKTKKEGMMYLEEIKQKLI